MRQNTAVLGITCFIEASRVALRESERKKWQKEDRKEAVVALKRRILHWMEAEMQLPCP